ncbi:hypothetical protein [Paraclostridium sordellii]|uniref:hypothetical protein n=1 Tax=Paraclostridium sordellii TaxID=1505 RepID=UPI0005E672A4|nr:hypothetical protein [Paeniclostridium sordellii]CEN26144.1 Uncharacterised protein [[Clostridium] sordellii] [Paeniclostridium sordellii]
MIKAKNKIYIGSSRRGYLSEEMISVIYEYLANQEIYEFTKAKPRKIGDRYLLEVELNDYTKQLLKDLRSMNQIKLYKRTHSWEDIYKMADSTVKSS